MGVNSDVIGGDVIHRDEYVTTIRCMVGEKAARWWSGKDGGQAVTDTITHMQ